MLVSRIGRLVSVPSKVGGAGAREIRGREEGEERAGSGSSKRAGRSGEKCEILIILI